MTALLATLKALVPPPCEVLLLDLESVLIPEIWETVARVADAPELALTTRDIPDYNRLMERRIAICRRMGLNFKRLRKMAAHIEPLDGARDFLAWAQNHATVSIVSDTFCELAEPLFVKLGSPEIWCHTLTLDAEGYISGFTWRNPEGKASAVADFQRRGQRVAAVGDSFNDLGMLHAADAGFLFRPGPRLATQPFPSFTTYHNLKEALSIVL